MMVCKHNAAESDYIEDRRFKVVVVAVAQMVMVVCFCNYMLVKRVILQAATFAMFCVPFCSVYVVTAAKPFSHCEGFG